MGAIDMTTDIVTQIGLEQKGKKKPSEKAKGIYLLRDDILIICFAYAKQSPRPEGFSTAPLSNSRLVILRRGKLNDQAPDGDKDHQQEWEKNAQKLPGLLESEKDREPLPKDAVARLKNGKAGVRSFSLTADGKHAITGSVNGIVRIWNLPSGRELRGFTFPKSFSGITTTSPDGKYLACLMENELGLGLYDAKTGKRIRAVGAVAGHGPMAFSPSGRILVDDAIELYDVQKGGSLKVLKSAPVRTLAFSPDGELLLVGTADGFVSIWEVSSGTLRKRVQIDDGVGGGFPASRKQYGPVDSVAFSANGHLYGAAALLGTYRLFETATGVERMVLKPYALSNIGALAFSADGKLLALDDGGVRGIALYRMAGGPALAKWPAHSRMISTLAFTPDGKHLISQSDDCALIWDLKKKIPAQAKAQDKVPLEECWKTLAGHNGPDIHWAIWKLVEAPAAAIPFLKKRLEEMPRLTVPDLDKLLADLDSPEFKARAQAFQTFANLRKEAESFLRKALEKKDLTLEKQQAIERLLKQIAGPPSPLSHEELRVLRTLEVLELIATPQAREVLAVVPTRTRHPYLRKVVSEALARIAKKKTG
jgi:WD40 repeat protein